MSNRHVGGFEKVISIASGKGGVGKTLTTVHTAYSIASRGKRVLIFDADFGMANVDVVLGITPKYNINDVIDSDREIEEVILRGPMGIDVIPSGSGNFELSNLTYVQRLGLLEKLSRLKNDYDVLIIDTGAGISSSVIHMNAIADKTIVVTTSEPHAMTDGYGFIKVLSEKNSNHPMGLVVNSVKSEAEGLKVYNSISEVARRFLNRSIIDLGSVPFDPQMKRALMARKVINESTLNSISGQAWHRVVGRILDGQQTGKYCEGTQNFWKMIVNHDANHQYAV